MNEISGTKKGILRQLHIDTLNSVNSGKRQCCHLRHQERLIKLPNFTCSWLRLSWPMLLKQLFKSFGFDKIMLQKTQIRPVKTHAASSCAFISKTNGKYQQAVQKKVFSIIGEYDFDTSMCDNKIPTLGYHLKILAWSIHESADKSRNKCIRSLHSIRDIFGTNKNNEIKCST